MDAPLGSAARARRVAGASAALGVVAWVALVATGPHDAVARWAVERWVAIAILVYVPFGIWLVGRDGAFADDATDQTEAGSEGDLAARAFVVGAWLQPAGAAAAVASAFVASRTASALLASAWIVVTGVLAVFGVLRARRHGLAPLSELLVDAGFAYAVVGAVALVLARLEISLVFRPVIVHLTAIHYHYAGFVLPLVAGLTGRYVEATYPASSTRRQVFRATGATVLVGMVVIAVGITASPLVEVVAVVAFTVAVAAFALLSLSVLPRLAREHGARGVVASVLVAASSVGVVATMAFAVGYGWSAFTGETVVDIGTMIRWHGTINALAFAACGLAGWALVAPASRASRVPSTFSPLRSRWRVGANYPERSGSRGDPDRDPPGQLDALADLAAPGFDPAAVAPDVRRFYERTGAYALSYDVSWHAPFRSLARLASPVTASVEQLNLPGPGDDGPHHAAGRIVGVDPAADPRDGARFWVRTHATADDLAGASTRVSAASVDGGTVVSQTAPTDARTSTTDAKSVFVAAYALHEPVDGESTAGDAGARSFVNVGLPLPGANLTGILAPANIDASVDADGTGLAFTTEGASDEGLYLATALGVVRVPLHETFSVWPADAPAAPTAFVDLAPGDVAGTPDAPVEGVLVATHEMWAFDVRFLSISYVVYPLPHASGGSEA